MGMSCIKIIKNLKLYSNDKSKNKTTRPHLVFKKINKKLLFYFYTLDWNDWNGSQKLSNKKPQTKFRVVKYLKVALLDLCSTCYYEC